MKQTITSIFFYEYIIKYLYYKLYKEKEYKDIVYIIHNDRQVWYIILHDIQTLDFNNININKYLSRDNEINFSN